MDRSCFQVKTGGFFSLERILINELHLIDCKVGGNKSERGDKGRFRISKV